MQPSVLEHNRFRTHTWSDPKINAAAMKELSGIEYFRAVEAGKLPPPPALQLVGMDIAHIEPDHRITFTFSPAEYHCNPAGVVHGGILTTVLDSAMACTIHAQLPAGTGLTTIELKVNFIRPITPETGKLSCTGTILNLGNRVALAEASLVDATGKLYAHSTSTCMIFPIP
ncbi:MAG: PaaI family thioesterase [Blastocatellia bacterium]|nr:PaaI family thioesterase [Blastocatellia bacterium]